MFHQIKLKQEHFKVSYINLKFESPVTNFKCILTALKKKYAKFFIGEHNIGFFLQKKLHLHELNLKQKIKFRLLNLTQYPILRRRIIKKICRDI